MPPEAKAIWLREIKPTEGARKDLKRLRRSGNNETLRRMMWKIKTYP